MMIVVPTFSMREKTPARKVGSLNSRSSDDPATGAGIVRKVGYDPVARHANGHPDKYAPHDPVQPTQHVKDSPERDLMQGPGGLHEPIPRITGELGFNDETRRICESESAVQLPQGINPDTPPVGEEIVASGLSLRPVPDIVNPKYSERAGHAHKHPQPDQDPLERLRTVKGPVYQSPVHTK